MGRVGSKPNPGIQGHLSACYHHHGHSNSNSRPPKTLGDVHGGLRGHLQENHGHHRAGARAWGLGELMSQPQHPIDRYITWAQWMPKDEQRPRRWVEDVGWDKVSETLETAGELGLTAAFKEWRTDESRP